MPLDSLLNGCPKINQDTTFDELMRAVSAAPPPKEPDLNAAATNPSSGNPAIAQCCKAYADVLKLAPSKGRVDFETVSRAEKAYREAMPPLSGNENIRDFLACLAHGMLIGAISLTDGTRLTYVAQVAYSARHIEPKIRRNILQELKTATNDQTAT